MKCAIPPPSSPSPHLPSSLSLAPSLASPRIWCTDALMVLRALVCLCDGPSELSHGCLFLSLPALCCRPSHTPTAAPLATELPALRRPFYTRAKLVKGGAETTLLTALSPYEGAALRTHVHVELLANEEHLEVVRKRRRPTCSPQRITWKRFKLETSLSPDSCKRLWSALCDRAPDMRGQCSVRAFHRQFTQRWGSGGEGRGGGEA